jgi:hypothetical protein
MYMKKKTVYDTLVDISTSSLVICTNDFHNALLFQVLIFLKEKYMALHYILNFGTKRFVYHMYLSQVVKRRCLVASRNLPVALILLRLFQPMAGSPTKHHVDM